MALKIFRALWFLSVMVVLANLLYVYASLPEEVVIQDEATGATLANREFLFYAMTGFVVIVNVLVYIIGILHRADESFRAWFHGLVITFNVFFIFAMSLILTYNSGEVFNYSSIGFLIYGSVGLMVMWSVSWPLYSIFRKLYPKQAI